MIFFKMRTCPKAGVKKFYFQKRRFLVFEVIIQPTEHTIQSTIFFKVLAHSGSGIEGGHL